MKVLIVNTFDSDGGAARATKRLHDGLIKYGINSKMLVMQKKSLDANVITVNSLFIKYFSIVKILLDLLPARLYNRKLKEIFSSGWLSSKSVVNKINSESPDIVHLHWVNSGFLSINDIAKIKSTIVWSMHDNWLYTGGCHVSHSCFNFQNKCGNCPKLDSTFDYDLSRLIYNRKLSVMNKIPSNKLHFVALSKWIGEQAATSKIMSKFTINNFPNPINTSLFTKRDKLFCRKLLNLNSSGKKFVLFGALNPFSDYNKGFHLLQQVVRLLSDYDITFLVIGGGTETVDLGENIDIINLGKFSDDLSLTIALSAADLFISPSLQENLSNSIMESLACGTPVVAFNTGGNSDLIIHRKNGYLANKFEIEDFSKGIVEILYNSEYEVISNFSKKNVIDNFSEEVVIPKYIQYYNSLL